MAGLPAEIQRLFDGLWDTAFWQSGLDGLCLPLRAHHIDIIMDNAAVGGGQGARPLCWGARVNKEHLEALRREAGAMLKVAGGMPIGVAMDTAEVVPDRELFKSEIYNNVIRPMDGHYGITASPFAGGILAVCRPPTAPRFAGSDIGRLQAILPYLQVALRLKRRLVALESRVTALERALDELSVGLAIAGRSGRMLYANRSAEEILRTIASDRESGASQPRLREIVGRPDGRRYAIPRGPSKRPVLVRSIPITGAAAERLPASSECEVAIFLRDPDRRADTPRAELMAALGLTAREASLAELLARDVALTDAAAMLGITRENARVHLKRIFSKTETRRQAELVSLILRSTI